MTFTNLHLHTAYSIQDSVVKIPDLIKTLKKYNQKQCAITDHASLAGHYEFSKQCAENNIEAILGNEFYITPYHNKKTRQRFHLLLLAENEKGLLNLRKLQRIAVENHYYKPLLSYKDIFLHKDGLFLSTACSLSPISQAILDGNRNVAENIFRKLLNEFGKEHFAIEWQFHPQYSEQKIINETLLDFNDKYDIKYQIATCDTHFITEEDRDTRKKIQAISWHKNIKDVQDSLISNCLGTKELVTQFAEESNFSDMNLVKKMIKNTNKVANLCKARFNLNEKNDIKVPSFTKYNEYEKLIEDAKW